jgi:hypothetical protein
VSYARIIFVVLVLPLLIIPPLQMGIDWGFVFSTAYWVICNPIGTIDILWDSWGGAVVGLIAFLIASIWWILGGALAILGGWGRLMLMHPQIFDPQQQQPYGSLPDNSARMG